MDHLPEIRCYVSTEGGRDSLVVENSGHRARRIRADGLVFFDVEPWAKPNPPQLVRYLVSDYYRDQLSGDYEVSQRVVYGLAGSFENFAFLDSLRWKLADSLRTRGLEWDGIEIRQAVKVVYWDWLGKRMEECYGRNLNAGSRADFVPIRASRWKQLKWTADSLRSRRRTLAIGELSKEAAVRRVVQDCRAAVAR